MCTDSYFIFVALGKNINAAKKMTMYKEHFGKSSIFSVYGIILIITFIGRINLLHFEKLGALPIYYWVVLVICFYVFMFVNRSIPERVLNIFFLTLTAITAIYLNSALQWSVEHATDEYESMYEWNAEKSLSFLIDVPLVMVILFIQGLIFDIIMKRRTSAS